MIHPKIRFAITTVLVVMSLRSEAALPDYEVLKNSVVYISTDVGHGAGIVVGTSGTTVFIATGLHVVVDPDSGVKRENILVSFHSERFRTHAAQIFGESVRGVDLAVLFVDLPRDSSVLNSFVSVPYQQSSVLKTGLGVATIGHPGSDKWLPNVGVLRVQAKEINTLLLTGGGIGNGSSGGPLVDENGYLIGMICTIGDGRVAAVKADVVYDALAMWNLPTNFVDRYEPCSIRIDSVPAGATLLVNGRESGKTPAHVKLPSMAASSIRLRKSGFREAVRTIRCSETTVSLTLDAIPPPPPEVQPATPQLPIESRPSESAPLRQGLVRVSGGLVPASGWEWVAPNDKKNLEIRPARGYAIGSERQGLRPASGWEWSSASPTIMEVRLKEGLAYQNGEFLPAEGWEWVAPKDKSNLEVRLKRGYAKGNQRKGLQPARGWEWVHATDPSRTEVRLRDGLQLLASGEFLPVAGWEWSAPEDKNNLQVRLKAGYAIGTERQGLQPARGWEWASATGLEIRMKEGYRFENGRLLPRANWEWTYPDDPNNFDVRLKEGYQRSTERGEVLPAVGWEWVDGKDPANLEVRLKVGYRRGDTRGTLKPAAGWEWVDPKDKANYEVRLKEGYRLGDTRGDIKPAAGWGWVKPNDAANFEVRLKEGYQRGDKRGEVKPAPGWEWVLPDDRTNFAVRRKATQ